MLYPIEISPFKMNTKFLYEKWNVQAYDDNK